MWERILDLDKRECEPLSLGKAASVGGNGSPKKPYGWLSLALSGDKKWRVIMLRSLERRRTMRNTIIRNNRHT
jgi:hypothetical protein